MGNAYPNNFCKKQDKFLIIDEPNLGQQALDKVAKMAVSSQLDEVEDIKIDIDTDSLELYDFS